MAGSAPKPQPLPKSKGGRGRGKAREQYHDENALRIAYHPASHIRQSIPSIRLEQPLPALPSLPRPVSPVDMAPQIRIEIPSSEPNSSLIQFAPYHDDETPSDGEHCADLQLQRQDGGDGKGKGKGKSVSFGGLSSTTPTSRYTSPIIEGIQTLYRDYLSPKSPRSPAGISISISRPQSPSLYSQSPTSQFSPQGSSAGFSISVSRAQSFDTLHTNTSQISPRNTSGRFAGSNNQDNGNGNGDENGDNPPGYQPMYDYLRSARRPIHAFTSPNSNTFLSPTSRAQSPVDYVPYTDHPENPFIITLSPIAPFPSFTQPQEPLSGEARDVYGTRGINETIPRDERPGRARSITQWLRRGRGRARTRLDAPPTYEELFRQHSDVGRQGELEALVRRMDMEGSWAEEVCKYVVGLVMLSVIVVACVVAFGWVRV